MKIDILIVSKNRPILLQKCLACLREACASTPEVRFSVLLGLTDSQAPMSLPDLSVYLHNFSTSLTAPEKRNFLIGHSKADWLFFCDDDVEVPSDIFRHFITLLTRQHSALVFGGPNLTPPTATSEEHYQGGLLASKWKNPLFYPRYRKCLPKLTTSNRYFCLCNLFVKRIPEISFTHTDFCGEELQLLTDLKNHGNIFFYSPELWVYHHRRKSRDQFYDQLFAYGRGRGKFLRKNSSLIWRLVANFSVLFVPRSLPWAVAYLHGVQEGLGSENVSSSHFTISQVGKKGF